MSSSVEQPTNYFNCYKPTKRKLDQRDQFYQGETSGGNVSYYDCDITTKYVCLAELDCASENAMDISSETSSPRAQYSSHGSLFPEGATPLGATGLLCTAENQHGFVLQVIDEPEENYRARYESEGCRGPMKGRNAGGCPSVAVYLQDMQQRHSAQVFVNVELTSADGTPLQTCRLDNNDDGTNLFKSVKIGEKACFDNLRIRRLKKTESKVTPPLKVKGSGRGKHDEKQAHLLFTATIQSSENDKPLTLKVLSKPIYLNANHDPPEIHKIVPSYATASEQIAIIGTRMHSPRVTFIYNQDGREVEINADIEKEVSHQNALVVKVPQLPNCTSDVVQVSIRVTAGKGDRTGKDPLKSQPSFFTYIRQGQCKDCAMSTYHNYQPLMSYHMSTIVTKPNSPLGHTTPPPITMATTVPVTPPIPMTTCVQYGSAPKQDVDDILEALNSPVISPQQTSSPYHYSGSPYTQPILDNVPPQYNDFDQYLPEPLSHVNTIVAPTTTMVHGSPNGSSIMHGSPTIVQCSSYYTSTPPMRYSTQTS